MAFREVEETSTALKGAAVRFSAASLFGLTTLSALALWWFGPTGPVAPASRLREQLAAENQNWPAGLREREVECCCFCGIAGRLECIYPHARGMGTFVFVEQDPIGEPRPIMFAIPAGAVIVPAPIGSSFLLDIAIGVTIASLCYWCLRLA